MPGCKSATIGARATTVLVSAGILVLALGCERGTGSPPTGTKATGQGHASADARPAPDLAMLIETERVVTDAESGEAGDLLHYLDSLHDEARRGSDVTDEIRDVTHDVQRRKLHTRHSTSTLAAAVRACRLAGIGLDDIGASPPAVPVAEAPRHRWCVRPVEDVDGPDALRRVATQVERLGVERLTLTGANVTDTAVAHLAGLTGLRKLALWATGVTDDGLVHLQGMTGLRELSLSRTAITDAGLVHLREMTGLRVLNLSHTGITDAGLAHLGGLTGLRVLNMTGTSITGPGLAHLSGMTGLWALDVPDTGIGAPALAHLAALGGLRALDLGGGGIADDHLAHIAGLTGLRELGLSFTDITNAGVAHLRELTGLRTLDLSCTDVTDAGVAHLGGMTGLRELVPPDGITDAGVAHLAPLTGLRVLHLGRAGITDACLAHLEGLTGLRALDLSRTEITDAGVAHLEALAELRVLDLGFTGITDAGLAHLHGSSGLRSLDLTRANVTDAGVRPLTEAVPALKVDYEPLSGPERAQWYTDRGEALGRHGDRDGAIENFTEAVAADAGHYQAYLGRATAHALSDENDRAIADYAKGIELHPDPPRSHTGVARLAEAYFNRGVCSSEEGLYERAIADFTRAVEVELEGREHVRAGGAPPPGAGISATAYHSRGVLHGRRGELDRAMSDYTKAIELRPAFADAYTNRGMAYLITGDHDRAIADCDEAARLDPRNGWRYSFRAMAHLVAGDRKAAESDFRKAREVDPADDVLVWHFSYLLLSGGRPEEAAEMTTAYLDRHGDELDPRDSESLAYLQGKLSVDELIALAPAEPERDKQGWIRGTWFVVAMERFGAGDAEGAEQALRTCLATGTTEFYAQVWARALLSRRQRAGPVAP